MDKSNKLNESVIFSHSFSNNDKNKKMTSKSII